MNRNKGNQAGLTLMAVVLAMLFPAIFSGCSNSSDDSLSDGMARISMESAELMVMPMTRADADKGPYNAGYDTIRKDEESSIDVLWYDPVYEGCTPAQKETEKELTTLCNNTPKTFHKDAGSSSWTSTLILKSSRSYRLYAFTPVSAGNATIAPKREGGDATPYTCATVSLKDIPSISLHDYLYSVGNSNPNGSPAVSSKNAKGNFLYDVVDDSSPYGGSNRTYLVMNHLMSRLAMQIKLDADYQDVRDIYLKEVNVAPETGSAKAFTATLNYTSSSVDFSWTAPNTAADVDSIQLFKSLAKDGDALSCTDYTKFDTLFFIPQYSSEAANSVRFAVSFVFDVVDKASAVTRKEVTLTNTSILKQLQKDKQLASGTSYTMSVTVRPTYLYVLSDNDALDINIELN